MRAPHASPLPLLAVATTILVWAAAFPAITLALAALSPLPLASIRYAMAAAAATAWLIWMRPPRMPLTDLALCAACGVLGAAGYSVLLNIGQITVSAGAASFLVKTESIWMAVFAVLILKEHFSPRAWAGTALAFAGVGAIASAQPGGVTLGAGAPFVLAAAFCSAASFVAMRRLAQRHGALHVAAVMFIAAALALSPWLAPAIVQFNAASDQAKAWVIFLGVLPTTVGQACWTYALGHFGAARAGNFLYLVAPLAYALAWLLSGEPPAAATILGGALILGGVMLVNAQGARPASPTTQPAQPTGSSRANG